MLMATCLRYPGSGPSVTVVLQDIGRCQRCFRRRWPKRVDVGQDTLKTMTGGLYLFYPSFHKSRSCISAHDGLYQTKTIAQTTPRECISQALLPNSLQISNQHSCSSRYTTYSHFAQRLQNGPDLRTAHRCSTDGHKI